MFDHFDAFVAAIQSERKSGLLLGKNKEKLAKRLVFGVLNYIYHVYSGYLNTRMCIKVYIEIEAISQCL